MEGGRKTADVARELGVSAGTLYAWKSKYGGMQVNEAKRHPDAGLELSVALQVRGYIRRNWTQETRLGVSLLVFSLGSNSSEVQSLSRLLVYPAF
jgi:transposase-like protein